MLFAFPDVADLARSSIGDQNDNCLDRLRSERHDSDTAERGERSESSTLQASHCKVSDDNPIASSTETHAELAIPAGSPNTSSLASCSPSSLLLSKTSKIAPVAVAPSYSAGSTCVSRLHVPANTNTVAKAWRSLSDAEKESVILAAAEIAGAWSFRLTFSPRKEAALREAAAFGVDIRQLIADSIAHQFRRRQLPVPLLAFAIEEAPRTYRLHIHGAYVASIDRDVIREAFVDAGDRIEGKAGGSQFWHDRGWTLSRYFAYARKNETSVKREFGIENVTFINNLMRRHGREWHVTRIARKAASLKTRPVAARSEEDILADLADIPDCVDR